MTERAQPGAIDSVVRNDELAQVFGQLTGGYDDGWVVPADDPTPAAQRRSDIDTSGLNAFAISTSASSLDVTVDGGEAFAAGWCALDEATTLSLPADTTSTVVVTWDPDAVYDPDTDADRDAADSVVVDVATNVSGAAPRVVLFDVETDGTGVTGVTDRRQIGAAVDLDAGSVESPPSSDSDIARLADVNTALTSITSLGRNINNLTQEVARTQFEVGLSELGYPTGFYDAFVDDSKIASQTGLDPTFGADGFLALSDVLTIGAEQGSFSGHTNDVLDVAIDGSYGYSASSDGTVKKWDLETLTQEDEFTGHANAVNAIAIGTDHGYSASDDTTVKKWDLATLTEQAEFTDHTDEVNSVAVSDGFGYSGGDFDGSDVRKWDTDTLTQQDRFTNHDNRVFAIAIDAGFGYSAGASIGIKKWDIDTLTEQDEFTGNPGSPLSIAVDDGFGYSGDSDGVIKKWDTDTLTEQAEFTGHSDNVWGVIIDGTVGYSASADNTVKKWSSSDLAGSGEFTGHTAAARAVALGQGYGYSGGADDVVRKWDEGEKQKTNGSATTPFKDIGMVPDRLVIGRDATVPTNTTLNYKVEDDAGNVETFTESEVDTEVSLPSISTSNVRTTLVLDRDTTDDPTPELNSYALYLSE